MYKKKISTIAIITVLTLTTLLAAIPMASAINNPTLYAYGFPTTGGWCYSQVDVVGDGATAFGLVEVYWDTLGTKLGEGYADSAGAYNIKRIVIPFDVEGIHNVIVYDVLSSLTAYTTYDIDPALILMDTKGLPGDSIMAMGSGFEGEVDVQIYLGAITSVAAESVTITPGVSVTGTLANAPVVITTVDIATDVTITGLVGGAPIVGGGALDISVTDDGEGNLEGTADVAVDDGVVTFAGVVTVDLTGTINYATGAITLTASGSDEGSGDPVTDIVVTIDACDADYDYSEYIITPTAGITTGDDGTFQESIIVPAIAEVDYGDYVVTAIDTDGNVNTVPYPPFVVILSVNYYITLTPAAGPTGITTTITGRIKANTDYEIRFGSATIATGTSAADGSYSATYTIPAVLPEQDYTVSIVWAVTVHRDAIFTVLPPPALTKIQPPSGVAGAVITISGSGFSAGADISLYLGTTLVNSTEMDDRFGPTGAPYTANAGKFTDLEFTVPTITPGVYVLRVVDEYGASTGTAYTFTVLPTPVTTVTINAASYYRGDALSFTFVSTDSIVAGPTCTIRDPTGSIWWTATWTPTVVGPLTTVPYPSQLFGADEHAVLPADAPLGSWNWTVTYTPSNNIPTKATGLFTVAAVPSMQNVIDALDANTTTLLDAMADLTSLLDALDAKITAIDGTVATIDTTLGPISTSLSSLDATITGLDGDIATIQTSVGGVTTSLASIDTVVGAMYGDVMTINTTVGTIEGTLMDMDGSIATIETDLGTVKLDVAAIETEVDESLPVTVDMLPMWIAVILSLVAAIAAIFAVITIRQKIAG
jgi:hypothetical protein